jgi:hypothetical protein
MTDIPVSTAPAVREWLFDQCAAGLAPDPLDKTARLLVAYDAPGTDQPEDIVVIGEVSTEYNTNSLVGSGGAGWLEERYRVTVDIEIFRGGDSAKAVSDRAHLLAGQVINIVRADPTLGANVLIGRPAASTYKGDVSDDHSARLGTLSLQIEAYQRL